MFEMCIDTMSQVMCLCVVVFFSVVSCCERYVTLKCGETSILGMRLVTAFGQRQYGAFYSIPYAEPPVGELRFKSPKEKPDLFGHQSHDYSKFNGRSQFGFEDCLYLSIYMPDVNNQTDRLPVLVWICEYGDEFDPDFFIDEDIIVVTVRHRERIFGFLNTDDEFAKGNMAAKDVITALKWLKKNISYFHGDDKRITILGIGDGAMLASSMLVSSVAEDLYNAAIIIDGSALSPSDYRSYNFETVNKLYWKLKGSFDKFDRRELYKNLISMSGTEIKKISNALYDSSEVRNRQRSIKSFGGTIETNRRAFINRSPLEIYKREQNSRAYVIFGYSSLGSLYRLYELDKNRKLLKYLNYNFQYLLPFEGKSDEYQSKRYKKIKRKIMEFYFSNGSISERSLRRYAKYCSDQIVYPMIRQARFQSRTSPVYLFRFAFRGRLNAGWNTYVPDLNWKGATFGDIFCYLFKCKFMNESYSDPNCVNEREFIGKIVRLLANFVKHGNPTPGPKDNILNDLKWLPLDGGKNIRELNLGRRFKMTDCPEAGRIRFWDELKDEFF